MNHTLITPAEEREKRPKNKLVRSLGLNWFSPILFIGFTFVVLAISGVFGPLAKVEFVMVDWNRPLVPQIDWLLIFDFALMMALLSFGADAEKDLLIIIVGLFGGLYIESWGTQTELWVYYTEERPPWWIIPAWPLASLAIDRLVRLLNRLTRRIGDYRKAFAIGYWITLIPFYLLMLSFVWPTIDKSLTIVSVTLCALVIFTPFDCRTAFLNFIAGAALGYFLELWGTTRYCWTYYTLEQPPLFAVLAHGMAAVAFWRAGLLIKYCLRLIRFRRNNRVDNSLTDA